MGNKVASLLKLCPKLRGLGCRHVVQLWRCWLPMVLGALVPTLGCGGAQWNAHVFRVVLGRSCASRARQPVPHAAFSSLHCAQHADACVWKSWPVLCVHEKPPILGSS